jgi:hypothetical protein
MTEKNWIERSEKVLLGRRILKVRYMTQKEAEEMGWDNRAIVIGLDNGTVIFPSMDDEGNNAGAIFTTDKDLPTIPVF